MIFANMLLGGRRILVTGASSGIGRETAVLLARCGAEVILTGRDEKRLAAAHALLNGEGHEAHVLDLAGGADIPQFLNRITEGGKPLSGLFHAAGVELVRPVKLTKAKQIDDVFSSSINSALALARGCSARSVMTDGGAMVFMSSVAA